MSNYLINDKFIKRFEELQRAVGVNVSDYKATKSDHFIDSNSDTIQVRILSVVENPDTGNYVEGSAIQFTGRQVYQNEQTATSSDARLNFDSSITSKEDTADRFDVGNLYGIGIEFDVSSPLDIEDEFVDKVFDATRKLVKTQNEIGEFENRPVWSITPASSVSNFAQCTITAAGANDYEYEVDVKLGNPNLPAEGTLPKGLLFFNYATTNPASIGAKLMVLVYPSTEEVPEGGEATYKYDCFPIETTLNLVAPPAAPVVP